MSSLGDALEAIRNVVLMQERLEVMDRKVDRLATDVKGLSDYAAAIDKRVVRIETIIEMSARSSTQPRIEG
jgi:archaellum component FlaC